MLHKAVVNLLRAVTICCGIYAENMQPSALHSTTTLLRNIVQVLFRCYFSTPIIIMLLFCKILLQNNIMLSKSQQVQLRINVLHVSQLAKQVQCFCQGRVHTVSYTHLDVYKRQHSIDL